MKLYFTRLLFFIIRFSPSNVINIWIYKYYFKYRIGENVIIKGIINCKEAIIEDNVYIGPKNFIRANRILIGSGTRINFGNKIFGKADFKIGSNSRIIHNHYIDLWNDVEIGCNSWIAGRSSQIWTHGSLHTKKKKDLKVKLGNSVYVGSNCLIAPGIHISDFNLIALGSVVLDSVDSSKNIIMGNPSKVIKKGIDWRDNW